MYGVFRSCRVAVGLIPARCLFPVYLLLVYPNKAKNTLKNNLAEQENVTFAEGKSVTGDLDECGTAPGLYKRMHYKPFDFNISTLTRLQYPTLHSAAASNCFTSGESTAQNGTLLGVKGSS